MNRHPPSNYGDEPPAYDNEAASFLSHDDSPTAPPRHNGASMRLLPTSSNVDSDMSTSYRPSTPSQYSQYQADYADTTPYVSILFLREYNEPLFPDTFQLLLLQQTHIHTLPFNPLPWQTVSH